MHSREQYLDTLREDYRSASKKRKERILNEAVKRTAEPQGADPETGASTESSAIEWAQSGSYLRS